MGCDLKAIMVDLNSYTVSLGLLLPLAAGANLDFLLVFTVPQKPFWSTGTEFEFVQEMLWCIHFQHSTLYVLNGIK